MRLIFCLLLLVYDWVGLVDLRAGSISLKGFSDCLLDGWKQVLLISLKFSNLTFDRDKLLCHFSLHLINLGVQSHDLFLEFINLRVVLVGLGLLFLVSITNVFIDLCQRDNKTLLIITSLFVRVVHALIDCDEIFIIVILISTDHVLEDFDDLAEMSFQLRDGAIPVTKFIIAVCLCIDSIDESFFLLFLLC